MGSTPHKFNQNLWDWSPGISILKSSHNDYNVQPVLRITNPRESSAHFIDFFSVPEHSPSVNYYTGTRSFLICGVFCGGV